MRKEMVKEIQMKVASTPLSCLRSMCKHLKEMIIDYELDETLFHETYKRCDYNLEELKYYRRLLNRQYNLLKSLDK